MSERMRMQVLTYVVVLEAPESGFAGAKDFADRKFMTGWKRLRNANVSVGELDESGRADQVVWFGRPTPNMRKTMAVEYYDDDEPPGARTA